MENFLPTVKIISNILPEGIYSEIFFQTPHHFVRGNTIRVEIPQNFGMEEVSGSIVNVLETEELSILTDLNVEGLNPFSPPLFSFETAQAIPVGSTNYALPEPGFIPRNQVPIAGAFRTKKTLTG